MRTMRGRKIYWMSVVPKQWSPAVLRLGFTSDCILDRVESDKCILYVNNGSLFPFSLIEMVRGSGSYIWDRQLEITQAILANVLSCLSYFLVVCRPDDSKALLP